MVNMTTTSRWKNLSRAVYRKRALYLLLLPGLIYFVVYKYLPMVGIVMAFQDYSPSRGFLGSEWIGLKYFKQFFTYGSFSRLFGNTLTLSLLCILFSFPMPVLMALLLNEIRSKVFKRCAQTLMYLPHFLSAVVICSISYQLFSIDTGAISAIFKAMNMEPLNILMNKSAYRPLYVGLEIWQGTGWGTIIYLAALSGVDEQLYESAMLDGANRLQQTIFITIPSILPIVMVQLVLRMGDLLEVGAEKSLLLMNAMNRPVAEIFSTYVYNNGVVNGKYSLAAAVGLFQSAVGLILVLTSNALSKKVTDEAIY